MSKKKVYKWVDAFFSLSWAPKQEKIIKRLQHDMDEEEGAYEMESVYAEIEERLKGYKSLPIDGVNIDAKFEVMYDIITSAVLIESEEKQRLKDERDHLIKLQKDISSTVGKLIDLLNSHELLLDDQSSSALFPPSPYQDPIQLLREAGSNMRPYAKRLFFRKHVIPVLGMDSVFQPYKNEGNMPKLQELLQVLKKRMVKDIEPPGNIVERKLLSSRKAKSNNGAINVSDFIRVLDVQINRSMIMRNLPFNFTLTPKSLAIITRRVLDINDYTDAAVKKVFLRTVRS